MTLARLLAIPCAAAVLWAFPAPAQSVADFYKGNRVTIVVGSDVGGGYDLNARVLARHLGRFIPGNPAIVVQNKPGATSIVASNYVFEVAPKDGSVVAAVQRTIPYQAIFNDAGARFDVRKMQWIGSTTSELGVVVAWHTAPQQTAQDLFEREMTVGGSGPAGEPEIFARALNNVLGMKLRIVSGYPGQAQIALALERGEVQGYANWSWSDIIKGHADWLRDKKLRVLLQLGLKKSPDLPDVPLVMDLARTAEQRQVFEILMGWKAMGRPFFVAPGVPEDRRDALRLAFMQTMRDPDYLADAARSFGAVDPMSGTEMQQMVERIYTLPQDSVEKARLAVKPRSGR